MAVILVYLDAEQNTPIAKADDERLAAPAESAEDQDDDELMDEDDNEDNDDESVASEDDVVTLGAYLMERGIRQIETSHDEGETGMEINECMEVVFKAVMQSKMSASQRLLWEIDVRLQDDYTILDGLKGPLDAGESYRKEDWSIVADTLADRLAHMPVRDPNSDHFSARYDREHVMRWLLRALKQAGRGEEMIPILERETVHTPCYVELVKRLIESDLADKAAEWARKGFDQTLEKLKENPPIKPKRTLSIPHRSSEFVGRPSHAHREMTMTYACFVGNFCGTSGFSCPEWEILLPACASLIIA